MHRNKLDEVDITILEILQTQGRIKRIKLAESVGLSIPTISERLQKLKEHGVIDGFYAKINNHKIGLGLTAYIFLRSETSSYYPKITEHAIAKKEILECHAITGEGSHLLKVRVATTADLEQLLTEIQAWPGVNNTTTDIVLSTAKETAELSLDHLRTKSFKLTE